MGGDRHRPGRPGQGHLPAQRGRTPVETTDEGSAGWRLEFLLQSTQDPSLLVPAAQAWSDDGSLRRWLDRPHELLLAELGRASRIYPELAAGLRQATPCALDLDADGAHRFLAVVAPALDEAGFGVLLPSWWDRRARLGLKATASTPTDGVVAGGHFGRESLMDFRWQLAVGDDTLTDARSPHWPRRRRRWSGCAGNGSPSTPSSCGVAWSSSGASRLRPGPPPRCWRWPPATRTIWTPRCR